MEGKEYSGDEGQEKGPPGKEGKGYMDPLLPEAGRGFD
jgi:hypothetical protein